MVYEGLCIISNTFNGKPPNDSDEGHFTAHRPADDALLEWWGGRWYMSSVVQGVLTIVGPRGLLLVAAHCKNAGKIKILYVVAHTHSRNVSRYFINIPKFKNMSVTSCCVS